MTSVLDQMTAGIMDRKAKAASGLTPVAGETATSVAAVAALVPKDVPGAILSREALQDQSRELRAFAAQLITIAEGLDVMAGVPANVAAYESKLVEQAKVVQEREADRKAADTAAAEGGDKRAQRRISDQEKFDEALAAKAEAAQAAVYAAADDGAEEPVAPAGQWECPDHGSQTKQLESRSGRKYRACTQCDAFEPRAA